MPRHHFRMCVAFVPCARMTQSFHRRMYQRHHELLPKSEKSSKTKCEEQKTKKACSMCDSCEWLSSTTKCVSAVRPETMQSRPAPPYYNLRLGSFLQEYDPDRDAFPKNWLYSKPTDEPREPPGLYGFWSNLTSTWTGFSSSSDGPQVGLDLFVQHNINTFNLKKRVFPIHYPWAWTNRDENLIGPTAIVKGVPCISPNTDQNKSRDNASSDTIEKCLHIFSRALSLSRSRTLSWLKNVPGGDGGGNLRFFQLAMPWLQGVETKVVQLQARRSESVSQVAPICNHLRQCSLQKRKFLPHVCQLKNKRKRKLLPHGSLVESRCHSSGYSTRRFHPLS